MMMVRMASSCPGVPWASESRFKSGAFIALVVPDYGDGGFAPRHPSAPLLCAQDDNGQSVSLDYNTKSAYTGW
jgi:hypothetical protein